MEDLTYYNLIDDIEISNYFENYSDDDQQNLAKVSPEDDERTKRRKHWQNALKIGAVIGAATTLVFFGPEIIAMLTPVMPAIKASLKAKGLDPSKMKIGEILKKFHETSTGKSLDGKDEKKNGIQMAKEILGYFKNLKDKKANGTATPLETKMLDLADNATKKIAEAGEGEVKNIMKNLVAEGTGEPELAGTPVAKGEPNGTPPAKVETKFDTKTIILVLVAIFVISKFS